MLFRKLRGAMREAEIDQSDIADELGICPVAVSNRFTGRTDWRLSEMYAVLDELDVPHDRLHEYFPAGGMAPPTR